MAINWKSIFCCWQRKAPHAFIYFTKDKSRRDAAKKIKRVWQNLLTEQKWMPLLPCLHHVELVGAETTLNRHFSLDEWRSDSSIKYAQQSSQIVSHPLSPHMYWAEVRSISKEKKCQTQWKSNSIQLGAMIAFCCYDNRRDKQSDVVRSVFISR